ncbi:MAG: RNA polymerase sigma factor, partial [Acidimicrobiales bacterium]
PSPGCDSSINSATNSYERSSDHVHDLVERARRDDEQAWEALFRRAYPKLLAYASRRLPTQEQAKDAVGETMTRAVASIDRLRNEGGGFDAWMYGIMRHVVVDAQRLLSREGPGLIPDAADAGPLPGDRALDREDAAEVRRAFELLSPADQELLELRVVAELSTDEVATVLGRRPGAVRMAQSRALTRLRAFLGEEVGEPGGRASA